ncbi:uncharacterized protein LOC135207812 [Macrobrachium nipponense]|uniref:uncharacterized protein LOC135207812 n=1 Tax=Macrobrachium nipponense TaxID=159736 RepID=UPI0030C83532
MGRLQLLLATFSAILVCYANAYTFEGDIGQPITLPETVFSPDQSYNLELDEDEDEDEESSSALLDELLFLERDEVDHHRQVKELLALMESLSNEIEEIEEDEDEVFLEVIDAMKRDYREKIGAPSPVAEGSTGLSKECMGLQCHEQVPPPLLFGEEENGKRLKRSPKRTSSRGSSRSSSSGSSWLSRRRSSSSSSSGSSSGTSSSRGSSSSSSSSGTRYTSSGSSGSSSSSSSGSSSSSSSGSSSSSSGGSSYGWNTGSSGSKPSTGTGVATGTGTGISPGSSYPKQPGSGYPTGSQPSGGYPSGTGTAGGYPSGTNPVGGYPGGTGSAGGYPSGTNPVGGYPGGTGSAGGYPSGTNPVGGYPSGTRPGSGYPAGTNPVGGYPSGTGSAGGYPTGTNPVGGYPGGTGSAGGYPAGTNPVGGYPSGTRPVGGYPTGTNPVGGYPSGTRPVGGYPTGTNPVGGYPTGTNPVGGYPSGTRPVGGYPTHTQPVGGYPSYPTGSRPFGSSNQPFGGYPSHGQPSYGGYSGYQPYGVSHGYSTGSSSFGGFPASKHSYGGFPSGGFGRTGLATGGFAAGAFAGSHYPVGGFAKPLKKKTKKDKVKDVIKTVAAGVIAHKAHKKSKFMSPFGHHGMGYGGHKGAGLLGAGLGGLAVGKVAKKVLGAYVKIQIAKYALKFGAEAAKAYFMYKMGIELDDYMVGKFVHRYHQHRVYGDSRWRHRTHYHSDRPPSGKEEDNITLGEFCHRPCNESDKRVCQFSMEIHLYQTMSRACYNCPSNTTDCERPECIAADGKRRMVVVADKTIPGPAIQVCAGDKVLVDVFNNLPSTAVSLHWHGLTLGRTAAVPTARTTPFMDGAPGVTQCPIPPGSGFRYSFDATDPGTHFWHASTGLERGDGVFGPLVVHQSLEKDPMQGMAEHMFLVNDWFHSSTQNKYVLQQNSGEEAKPQSILINGQGRHKHDDTGPQVPYFNFLVEKSKRYRLRMINAASTNCPVTVSVDSHDFVLLTADGSSISPVNASSVLLYPGERYDAMFSAEQESGEEGATYWIRVEGGNDCLGLRQFASLQYLPANVTATPLPTVAPGIDPSTVASDSYGMNVFTGKCGTAGQRCVSGLRSQGSIPERMNKPKADMTFYLSFSSREIHNENIYSLLFYNIYEEEASKRVKTPQINNLSFRGSSTPLLVDQKPLRAENCSSEGVRQAHCSEGFCECLHIVTVNVGSVVDMVLIGEGNSTGITHPVHLHGYKFWVLAHVDAEAVPEVTPREGENITFPAGMSRDKAIRLDEEGRLTRYLESPVVKDTVTIPAGGYTIIRIAAENNGFWVLESQVLFDSQAGMSLVLQVGSDQDLPPKPKDFPTC